MRSVPRRDPRDEEIARDAYDAAQPQLAVLLPRERQFVWEYTIEPNATMAAVRAGYTARSAYSTAHRLLKKADIAAALAAVSAGVQRRTAVTAEMVVQELARVAFSDLGEAITWNDRGISFGDSATLPDRVRHAVKSVTVKRKRMMLPDGEGGFGEWEIEEIGATMHDKVAALAHLGKHFGIFDRAKGDGESAPLAFVRAVIAAVEQLESGGMLAEGEDD